VDKLDKIEQQSDSLLEHSNEIHNSLDSIESQAELLAQKSKVVEDKITNVIDQSNSIFEQSHQIIGTQSKLQEQQFDMRKTLDTSMADIQKSYVILGEDIGFLQTLTSQTQKQITEVAGTMSLQLDNLQIKADGIGNVVTLSLGQQKELLDGQSLVLQGLDTLTQTQAEAFEQSR
jgi:COX assembly protein 1